MRFFALVAFLIFSGRADANLGMLIMSCYVAPDIKEEGEFVFGACQDFENHTAVETSEHFAFCLKDGLLIGDEFIPAIKEPLETAYATFGKYGFPEPNDGQGIEVYITNDEMPYTHTAGGRWIRLASSIESTLGSNSLGSMGHELFHTVQKQMFSHEGGWMVEGPADWAVDIVPLWSRDNLWAGGVNYWQEAPWENSTWYSSSQMFWIYLTSFLDGANNPSDLNSGVSVMRNIYRNFNASEKKISPEVLDDVLEVQYGLSLSEAYGQFAMALYAKDLDVEVGMAVGEAAPDIYDVDYFEDETAHLDLLTFYEDAALLSSDEILNFSNEYTPFKYFGNVAPMRVSLAQSLEGVSVDVGEGTSQGVYLAVAIEYADRVASSGRLALGKNLKYLGIIDESGCFDLDDEFLKSGTRAVNLLIFPFTLEDPEMGRGSNFEFEVSGF